MSDALYVYTPSLIAHFAPLPASNKTGSKATLNPTCYVAYRTPQQGIRAALVELDTIPYISQLLRHRLSQNSSEHCVRYMGDEALAKFNLYCEGLLVKEQPSVLEDF